MKKVVVLVCVLVLSAMAFGQKKKTADAGAMKSGMMGTWKFDPAASTDPAWKTATITFTKDTEDATAFRMSDVSKDGKAEHVTYSAKKGEMAPLVGSRLKETLQWNKDNSFVVKGGDGGHAELQVSLSDDHQTMTVTGKNTDKDGKVTDVKDIWKRVGGAKKSAPASKAS